MQSIYCTKSTLCNCNRYKQAMKRTSFSLILILPLSFSFFPKELPALLRAGERRLHPPSSGASAVLSFLDLLVIKGAQDCN